MDNVPSRSRRRLHPSCDGPRAGAFTLVELLIVMAILAVLVSVLMPAIASARESSRRVLCLSNVGRLAQGAVAYMNENDGYLPDASAGNMPVICPLSPTANFPNQVGQPSTFVPGATVLPSIGGPLKRYLNADERVAWRCPGDKTDGFVFKGDAHYGNNLATDGFYSSYHYVCDKEWFLLASSANPITIQNRLREWTVRNVSGLRASKVTARQSSAEIVLFHDHKSIYHTPTAQDIYTATEDADYYASFGFLDGHAEGRRYRNVVGYLENIHRPIRQEWFGYDFRQQFPEQY